jgi:hypothetical protein
VLALPLTLAASAATFLAFLFLSTSRSIKISCLAWDAHERGRRGRRTEQGREGAGPGKGARKRGQGRGEESQRQGEVGKERGDMR